MCENIVLLGLDSKKKISKTSELNFSENLSKKQLDNNFSI